MRRKLLAIVIIFSIILNAFVCSCYAQTTTLGVKTTTLTANKGDIIDYSVELGPIDNLNSLDYVINVPEEFEFISYEINNCFEDAGFKNENGVVSFNPTNKKFILSGDATYSSTNTTTIMTFKCKVLDSASYGTYQVGISVGGFADYDYNNYDYGTLGVATVEVVPATVSATSISLNKSQLELVVGSSDCLVASVLPDDATDSIVWDSSNSLVASVVDGTINALSVGTTTITASAGSVIASCQVSVVAAPCLHEHTTEYEATNSTCISQGHTRYVVCDDCHEIIEGENTLLPLANHNLESIEKVDSTCIATGVKAHYICLECNKVFIEIGAGSYIETTLQELEIPKIEHNYSICTYKDDQKHTLKCSECGNLLDEEHETDEENEATCIKKALCIKCNHEYGEFDENNHKNIQIENKEEPTCTKVGYTGDGICNDCNQHITGEQIEPLGHTGGVATCSKKAICTRCQEEYGKLDPNFHNNTKLINEKEATQEEQGYTGDLYCLDCEEILEKGNIIPKLELAAKTSDDSNIYLWIVLLLVSGLAIGILVFKQVNKNKEKDNS